MLNSKYFGIAEFACKDGCGFGAQEKDIAPELVAALDALRETLNKPFRINSGARCLQHNMSEGGKSRSTHLPGKPGDCSPGWEGKCRASDISTAGWTMEQVGDLVYHALERGLRVGIAKTFVHIDVEKAPHYEQGLWTY